MIGEPPPHGHCLREVLIKDGRAVLTWQMILDEVSPMRRIAGKLAWGVIVGASAFLAAQSPVPPLPKGSNVLVGQLLDGDRPVGGAVVTLTAYVGEMRLPAVTTPVST